MHCQPALSHLYRLLPSPLVDLSVLRHTMAHFTLESLQALLVLPPPLRLDLFSLQSKSLKPTDNGLNVTSSNRVGLSHWVTRHTGTVGFGRPTDTRHTSVTLTKGCCWKSSPSSTQAPTATTPWFLSASTLLALRPGCPIFRRRTVALHLAFVVKSRLALIASLRQL